MPLQPDRQRNPGATITVAPHIIGQQLSPTPLPPAPLYRHYQAGGGQEAAQGQQQQDDDAVGLPGAEPGVQGLTGSVVSVSNPPILQRLTARRPPPLGNVPYS